MSFSCRVCQDRFLPSSEICLTACGHFFHVSCIKSWRESKSLCPECRQLIKGEPFRVYPDFQDTIIDLEDCSAMKDEVKTLQRTYEEEIRKNDELQNLEMNLKEQIGKEVEVEILANETIKVLTRRIKNLLKRKEELEPILEHSTILEEEIKSMSDIDSFMKDIDDKVQEMIKKTPVTPLAVHNLCVYVETLKKQLLEDEDMFKSESRLVKKRIKTASAELKQLNLTNSRKESVDDDLMY